MGRPLLIRTALLMRSSITRATVSGATILGARSPKNSGTTERPSLRATRVAVPATEDAARKPNARRLKSIVNESDGGRNGVGVLEREDECQYGKLLATGDCIHSMTLPCVAMCTSKVHIDAMKVSYRAEIFN